MKALPERPAIEDSRFLSALPREAAEAMVAAARSRLIAPREHGVRQGDPSLGLLWMHTGLLSVFFELADGSVHPHRIAWPNDVSSYGATETCDYPSSCVALIPSLICWVPRETIESVFSDVSDFAYSLFCYIARQEERLSVWTSHLLSLPVRSRIRLVLARLALEAGTRDDDGYRLDFPLTNISLATAAHVSRDEAGRAMRELLAEGVLKRAPRRRSLVPDVDALLGPTLKELARRVGLAADAESAAD